MKLLHSNDLLIAARNFKKNLFSVSVSVMGMGVAFAVAIVAYFNYDLNSTFDHRQLNADDIYRINFKHQGDLKEIDYGICPIPMGGLIKENIGDIDHVVRYEPNDLQVKIYDEVFVVPVAFTDAEFFDVFTLEVLPGGSRDFSGNTLLISTRLAQKYFGDKYPVGKSLTVLVNEEPREFSIGGVFPAFEFNSSLRFELLTNMDNFFTTVTDKTITPDNWKRWNSTFLHITDKSQVENITRQLQQYVSIQNEARPDLKVSRFYLDPLPGMGARARLTQTRGHWFGEPLPPAAVIVMFIVAIILLVVACVNITNTTIAIAGRRLKEIGIRKVLGSMTRDLRLQFLNESALLCLLSLALGFGLAEFLLPAWDNLWPSVEFTASYWSGRFWIFIGMATILAIVLSGSYPAFYISSFLPNQVLKGKVKFGGSTVFTRILLVIQLSISLMAIIFNIAFYRNSLFQENYDLGFDYDSVVQVPVKDQNEYDLLRTKMEGDDRIISMAGSTHHIFSSSYREAVKVNTLEKETDILHVGDQYFNTLSIRLRSGREFEANSVTDAKESVIVNEEFVRSFGLGEKAIGHRILWRDSIQLYVVGIVEDIYLNALFQPVQPLAFRYSLPADYKFLTIKADAADLLVVHEKAAATWKTLFPNKIFTGELMNEDMKEGLLHFQNVTVLYSFLGLVTIVLSMSGLFSMITIHVQKRMKEMGLRKMLGASISQLCCLAGKPFVIVISFSTILGTTAGVFAAEKFMDAVWEYYNHPSPGIIMTAIATMIFISVVSVLYRIIKSVRLNPVDVIREE